MDDWSRYLAEGTVKDLETPTITSVEAIQQRGPIRM